jgi:hypothetical protein
VQSERNAKQNECFVFISELPPIFGSCQSVQSEQLPPIFGFCQSVQSEQQPPNSATTGREKGREKIPRPVTRLLLED